MNPILVALDVPTVDRALALATSLEPVVGGYKVGLALLMCAGPHALTTIVDLGKPVFCDAKLHDIPNTVEAAARQIGALGVRWVTVHAAGGRAMMEAAVSGLSSTATGDAGVLAVTVLTSLDDEALAETGVVGSAASRVIRLAGLAESAGVEGVVCSVAELEAVKQAAPALMTVTPGVRPVGTAPGDQARVATPQQAVAAGADYLVIGRPITAAPDPVLAARGITAQLGLS